MPELTKKEAEVFEVQEAEDFAIDKSVEVSEDEIEPAHSHPTLDVVQTTVTVPAQLEIVVEEDLDNVPGSDAKLHSDEQKADAPKETDWANDRDHSKFVQYLDDKLAKIPKHSGETIPGCERAKHYLKDCLRDINMAVRDDFNSKIDESWADKTYQKVEDMIDRLDKQLDSLRSSKKASVETRLIADGSCVKCAAQTPMWHDVNEDRMVCLNCNYDVTNAEEQLSKTAATPVLNVYMNPFERAIVATIINSSVSAGKNIEETYMLLKNKYNFTPREELAIQQLVADYGYPVLKDRGRLNESSSTSDGTGVDFATNYHA